MGILPQCRAALLIDGSNFYHSLKRMGVLPFGPSEFKQLFLEISKVFALQGIIFYDAMKSSKKDPQGYSRQQRFNERLRQTCPIILIKTGRLRYLATLTDEQILAAMAEADLKDYGIDKIKNFLVGLKLFHLTKEKGVDIQLVVDAVEMAIKGSIETVIILSGDADFVPAIRLIRSYHVRTVNLHLFHGSSTELRNTCDEHVLIIPENKGIFLKRYSREAYI